MYAFSVTASLSRCYYLLISLLFNMFLHYWPLSLTQTLICASCLYAIRYAYWQWTIGARRRRLAASHGCQPIKKWRTLDPFFGLDYLWTIYRDIEAHKSLESLQQRFAETGANTARLKLLRQRWVKVLSRISRIDWMGRCVLNFPPFA